MTSETVQAAQRLLAERERFGLAKYGTTVDRTDLQAGDWLQHAIEEASDLLLYLLRLQKMIPRTPDIELATLSSLAGIEPDSLCACGDRAAIGCPGQWEPGCDLGANEAHAVPAPPKAAEALRAAMQPAAAPEDAERAAYLARWKDAPEWAQWLSQDPDRRCDFWEVKPVSDYVGSTWFASEFEPTHTDRQVADNLLGSVRCEPRPVQGVGP